MNGPLAPSWHLITGEYPPDTGGVADYTATLARALAEAGIEVHVWTGGTKYGKEEDSELIRVHRDPGRFGLAGLARLNRDIDRIPGTKVFLVQYVPHVFGWRAMNVPFAAWVGWRAQRGDEIRVMFHEVTFPWVKRPLRHNVIATANRLMAAIIAHACTQAYVSIPAWDVELRRLGASRLPITWTPVPATIPTIANATRVADTRAQLTRNDPAVKVIGHFSTYGANITTLLEPALRELLLGRPEIQTLLLGQGSLEWRTRFLTANPDLASQVVALGAAPGSVLTEHIRACDLMLQPYRDGASARRTTLMAALGNGIPVVTTLGRLSEAIWTDGPVVTVPTAELASAALELLASPSTRTELGKAGRRLYEERFAIERTVSILLNPATVSELSPLVRSG